MRLKIKLKLKNITLDNIALETAKVLNQALGHNHKWHDMEHKPYTCSFIMGGSLENKQFDFKEKPAFFYINTEDVEVIEAITKTGSDYDIQNIKTFNGYNWLSVKRIQYYSMGKLRHITNENKEAFINYVKNKYNVNIEIHKIKNSFVTYKGNSKLPVNDLLIRCVNEKNVSSLFESGIGGCSSIGFGFVEPVYSI